MWLLDELESLKDSEDLAIRQREETITYKELWRRSEVLSGYFAEKNTAGKPIVIYGDKEIDFVVAMHAALKTGVAYVPVDISYPVQRLVKITQQVEADIVINFSGNKVFDGETIELNYGGVKKIYDEYDGYVSDHESWVKNNDTCYILFTSGSTGEPKGVPIAKRCLVNFNKWFSSYCDISEDNYYVINQAPYSFDLSVIGLFISLPAGKCLLSVDHNMSRDLRALFVYLEKYRPTFWISTPSFFDWCSFDSKFNRELLPDFKRLVFVGEIFTKTLAMRIFERFPDLSVINAYGPTEATCLITACFVEKAMLEDDRSLPIGRMIDPNGSLPIDVSYTGDDGDDIGELLIISESVGGKYFNNQLLTEERFFETEQGQFGYKTGDLVFKDGDMLYYIGRKDFQIKLHGLRIELNDIEANLNRLPYISGSVVLPIYKDGKPEYLSAFVSLGEEQNESAIRFAMRVKNDLKELVPSYMVPKKVTVVEEFPLNVNGKIDRKKLLEEC